MAARAAPPARQKAPLTARLQAVVAAVERLLQVGEDVLDGLEADAEAHEAVLQPAREAVLARDHGVGHRGRVLDQRLRACARERAAPREARTKAWR